MRDEDRRDAINAGADELYQNISRSGDPRREIDKFRGCGGFDEVLVQVIAKGHSDHSELRDRIDAINEKVHELHHRDPHYQRKVAQIVADLWELLE